MRYFYTYLLLILLNQVNCFSQVTLQATLGNAINLVVAKDGTGNFTTVQAAINAIPNNSATRKVIFIKKGKYVEKVEVPASKTNLTLIGEDALTTIISYSDYSGSGKLYTGIITSANGSPIGTSTSATFYNAANDFALMNITIENAAGDVGQAVALCTHADRQFLYHCRLKGYQDTYYTWSDGRVYALDCYIEGAIDYIFGRGVAIFDKCQLHSVRSNSYITAAATDQNFKFGYVFIYNKLTANAGLTSVYLGRPWKAYGQTVFMNSEEGPFLSPAGWSIWNGNTNHTTCYYAEYKNCGSGSSIDKRASWSKQLTSSLAANYTLANFFDKNVRPTPYTSNWLPPAATDQVVSAVGQSTKPFISSACFMVTTNVDKFTGSGLGNNTYPNPFQSNFTLELEETSDIEITSLTGEVMESKKGITTLYTGSEFISGVYFLRIISSSQRIHVIKLIKE